MNFRGKLIDLTSPIVMGIINVTPDSFYKASRVQGEEALIEMAKVHLEAGATILDVGAMSTRPGAFEIEESAEIETVNWAIKCLFREYPDCLISVDTYSAKTAESALEAGVQMINDIGGGRFDQHMMSVVGRYRAPYVMMHNRAKSAEMMEHTSYQNLSLEISRYFYHQAYQAAEAGIVDIVLDPGIGFSKTRSQNFKLLRTMNDWSIDRPILIGLSRKSFIYKTLNINATDALNGTTAMHMVALEGGANILRAHDVKEAMECINLRNELRTQGNPV